MATPIIRFAGQTFEPLPSGALHWPAERALLVADLHLEKMSSFAKRGSFLPPYDTAMTLKRLAADLAQTRAETVISLGDSFHRDEGTTTLLDADRLQLDGAAPASALDLALGQPRSAPACARRQVPAAPRAPRPDPHASSARAASSRATCIRRPAS